MPSPRPLVRFAPFLFGLAWLVACAHSPAPPPSPTAIGPAASASPTAGATATATLPAAATFDGQAAFAFLEAQMAFGPRYPGSPGHLRLRRYIQAQTAAAGWNVETQEFVVQGFAGQNLIARANIGAGPVVILGAHYDTRRRADQSPGQGDQPVPGAVDGASGVAVLLELARTLERQKIGRELWLAFFDAEDNGNGGLPGWDWIAGSRFMADNLAVAPEAVVVVDMVGDADQQLYLEGNSDAALQQRLWQIAGSLGYGDAFIPTMKYTMIDDHLPFRQRGWVAVDIIDFDYPYWHTVEDTADKASPASLERVGRTLQRWLEGPAGQD